MDELNTCKHVVIWCEHGGPWHVETRMEQGEHFNYPSACRRAKELVKEYNSEVNVFVALPRAGW